MWALIDAIETSATPVYTYNLSVCGSAAALIFMAGHRRFMSKRAKVIVHEGSASLAGDAVKVMDASDSYRRELKRMKEYILERTNISKAQLGSVDKSHLFCRNPSHRKKKDAAGRHPIHLIILLRFMAAAERRQWSSAAAIPRRVRRVRL